MMQIFRRLHQSHPVRYPVDPAWYNPRVDSANLKLSDTLHACLNVSSPAPPHLKLYFGAICNHILCRALHRRMLFL